MLENLYVERLDQLIFEIFVICFGESEFANNKLHFTLSQTANRAFKLVFKA